MEAYLGAELGNFSMFFYELFECHSRTWIPKYFCTKINLHRLVEVPLHYMASRTGASAGVGLVAVQPRRGLREQAWGANGRPRPQAREGFSGHPPLCS